MWESDSKEIRQSRNKECNSPERYIEMSQQKSVLPFQIYRLGHVAKIISFSILISVTLAGASFFLTSTPKASANFQCSDAISPDFQTGTHDYTFTLHTNNLPNLDTFNMAFFRGDYETGGRRAINSLSIDPSLTSYGFHLYPSQAYPASQIYMTVDTPLPSGTDLVVHLNLTFYDEPIFFNVEATSTTRIFNCVFVIPSYLKIFLQGLIT